MKKRITDFIDWFESKFNFLIEFFALIGGIFCVVFAIVIFFLIIFVGEDSLNGIFIVLLPGIIGFLGVMVLIALRVVRFITKQDTGE